MKTTTLHLTLALLAGTAAAQEPQGPGGHRPPPQVPPILVIFDTDRDGVISAKEIESASTALATLDKNGDGQITREELRPPRPEGADEAKRERPPGAPKGHRPPPPVIAALDADKNGTLSADELKSAPEALLKLDKNADGELSPQELSLAGPRPPGPPDGGPDEPMGPE